MERAERAHRKSKKKSSTTELPAETPAETPAEPPVEGRATRTMSVEDARRILRDLCPADAPSTEQEAVPAPAPAPAPADVSKSDADEDDDGGDLAGTSYTAALLDAGTAAAAAAAAGTGDARRDEVAAALWSGRDKRKSMPAVGDGAAGDGTALALSTLRAAMLLERRERRAHRHRERKHRHRRDDDDGSAAEEAPTEPRERGHRHHTKTAAAPLAVAVPVRTALAESAPATPVDADDGGTSRTKHKSSSSSSSKKKSRSQKEKKSRKTGTSSSSSSGTKKKKTVTFSGVDEPGSDDDGDGDEVSPSTEPDELAASEEDVASAVAKMHTFRRVVKQPARGLVLHAVCDVCGERLEGSTPVLECIVCGFSCHVECQYSPDLPPCVSGVKQIEALLPKLRGNIGRRHATPLAEMLAAPPAKDDALAPAVSAFADGLGRSRRPQALQQQGQAQAQQPPTPSGTGPGTQMTIVELKQEIQEYTDKYAGFVPQIVAIQRWYRACQLRQMRAVAAKRMLVVNELLACERSYVAQLRLIVDGFQRPLTDALAPRSPLLDGTKAGGSASVLVTTPASAATAAPPADVPPRLLKVIFGNARALCGAVEATLAQLERCVQESARNTVTAPLVGPVFVAQIGNIAQHTEYVLNFNDALAALAQAQRVPRFAQLLREQQRAHKVVDVTDLLVVPVQHVPRYLILLERLLGRTHPLHPDHAPLVQALALVKRLAEYMNERRHMKEAMAALRTDVAGMQDVLSDSSRYLVMKGPLRSYPPTRQLKGAFDHCFLFNDMLVAAKRLVDADTLRRRREAAGFSTPRGEAANAHYAVVRRIPLNDKCVLTPYVGAGDKDAGRSFVFQLQHQFQPPEIILSGATIVSTPTSRTTTTLFAAESEDQQHTWLTSIRRILDFIAQEHKPPHIMSFEETLRSEES